MKKAIAALPAALLLLTLTACQTPSPQALDDATRAVQTACTVVQVAASAFDAYVAAKPGRIDAKGLAWKKGVMVTVGPICANPQAVADPGKTLGLVVQVGFALSDYIKGVDAAPVP